MPSTYDIYDIQITDAFTGQTVIVAGGVVQVCVAGTAHKATLYDPDSSYASLANPVSMTRGKMRFALSTGAAGQGAPASCDLYGMDAKGHFFVRKGVKPGDPTEIPVDGNRRAEIAIIPFAVADCTAGTEKDTSFVLPAGSIALPGAAINLTVAAGQGSKTISSGLLSSQSGGSATGFINGASLTTIAVLVGALHTGSTPLGGLLQETSGGGSTAVPVGAVISTAVNISYTITSGATLAEGFIIQPYELTSGPD